MENRPLTQDEVRHLQAKGALPPAVNALSAFKARVAKQLREVEHSGDTLSKFGGCCPVCWESRVREPKHAPDCELAALLKDCEA